MNKQYFQQTAKSFRAGRISLQQFTDTVFPKDGSESNEQATEASRRSATASLPQFGDRAAESHKGDFGRALLIGGSVGMAGAISLSSLAALRMGSGLVKVAVPSEILPTVAQFSPCYMTISCIEENGEFHGAALETLQRESRWADVIAIGPGMQRGAAQNWIVPQMYAETEQPMVVDADALNTLAQTKTDLSKHAGQRILTPHPGEFQRLIDSKITDRKELETRAKELAKAAGVVIVLKGNRTLVTDGQRHYHNQTGNPGMATAGSGDVLTGVITSLVGQGFASFDAATLGVHLHGLAGDMAAESRGQSSLIASDLIEFLGAASKSHSASSRTPIGFAANS
jgi:ADP-dependent NAD(P)H-hydrate dehydratase